MKHLIKKILRSNSFQNFISFLGAAYIWCVWHTSRWHFEGFDKVGQLLKNNQPIIICFWHGRMIMLPYAWHWPHIPFYMLLSSHKDGIIISKVVGWLGIKSIMGSSTRGGAEAVKDMFRAIKNGNVVGITPDGPRGPNQKVQPGIIRLAQMTGAAIIPITYCTKRMKTLSTWDKFKVPLPFNRGIMIMGDPIYAPRTMDAEKGALVLEEELNEVNRMADEFWG